MINEKELTFGYRENKLRKTFKKFCNKENWKKGCTAVVPDKKTADLVEKSFIFFHGCKPKVKNIPTYWRHKEGLVTFEGKPKYKIESKGYSC